MANEHSNRRAYIAWRHMRERCLNPRHEAFHRYGLRGIGVCPAWLASFDAFLSDMGDPPEGMTLDRADNSLGYSPENCRWADRKTQARNTRKTKFVHWNGYSISLAELCERLGVSNQMARKRLRKGWPLKDAVLCPSKPGASFKHRASPTTGTPAKPN